MKLTFILLSFAVHAAVPSDANAGSSVAGTSTAAAAADRGDARSPQFDGHSPASVQQGGGAPTPQPTRSSMLREFQHNPLKEAAIQRAAQLPLSQQPPAAAVYDDADAHQRQSPGSRDGAWVAKAKQHVFSRFDAALKLATHFAQFYNNIGSPQKVIYETDGGGFAKRRAPPPRNASWFAGPTPAAKSWSLQQLKEGDLFYFAIPLVSITHFSLEQVRKRAMRHAAYVKNSFTITPQAAKARRWFLYDMLTNTMPGIVAMLTELIELCALHGEENVKFPIVMFREQERHQDGPGEASLNAGNLVEVTDQVRFYFQSTAAQQQRSNAAQSAAETATSQYLRDVEAKIQSLQHMKFTGHEKSFLPDLGFGDDGSDADSDEISVAEPAGRVAAGALDPYGSDDDTGF